MVRLGGTTKTMVRLAGEVEGGGEGEAGVNAVPRGLPLSLSYICRHDIHFWGRHEAFCVYRNRNRVEPQLGPVPTAPRAGRAYYRPDLMD